MKPEIQPQPRKGYYFAKSASGYVACIHHHRSFAAARKCADGIHSTARVVFVPTRTFAPEEVTS